MSDSLSEQTLAEKVSAAHSVVFSELEFMGFSPESIHFFDTFPANKEERYNWWRRKSTSGDYSNQLKPEFNTLVQDIVKVISLVDNGIEKEIKNNVGSQVIRCGPIAYRWAAIHTKSRDKRIDVQFFINLTCTGLRVGIYFGKHEIDTNPWKSFVLHMSKNKDTIFEELIRLKDIGYKFLNTTNEDFAVGSDGVEQSPSDSFQMYQHSFEKEEFGIIKKLESDSLHGRDVLSFVLDCFVETRRMYELLQLSKFNRYKRSISDKLSV